jgi:hypothetical protein
MTYYLIFTLAVNLILNLGYCSNKTVFVNQIGGGAVDRISYFKLFIKADML